MERETVPKWGILFYDYFNHSAKIIISVGHDDTMNCVAIVLDREGSELICYFSSPDTLKNTFHFCIMIFPDFPVNTTSARIVKPHTIFITSCATTIMTWRIVCTIIPSSARYIHHVRLTQIFLQRHGLQVLPRVDTVRK